MNARVATTWTKPSSYSEAQRALVGRYPKRALDRIAVECVSGHARPLTCAPEKADGMCPPATP